MASRPRRRVVGAPIGVSTQTLLADQRAQEQQALQVQRESRVAAEKATSDKAKAALNIYQEYQSGNATFGDTMAALKAAQGQTNGDPELSQLLKGYIQNTNNTKQTRDINSKVSAYNSGALSYADLKTFLNGVNSSNDVINNAIAADLNQARLTENTRVMNSLAEQFKQDGNINNYQTALAQLRDQPGQTPAALSTINQAIDAGRQVATQLADERTYADWQSGKIGAAAAMAYFNGRVGSSTSLTDAQSADKFLQQIKHSADATAKSSASAAMKTIDENSKKDLEDYFATVVKPGITACDGDPSCVMKLYDGYGARTAAWAKMGGTLSTALQDEANRAGVVGAISAANAQFEKYQKDLAAQTKLGGEKNLTPSQQAGALGRAGELSYNIETSPFATPGQQADAYQARVNTVRALNSLSQDLLTKQDTFRSQSQEAATKLYLDIQRGGVRPDQVSADLAAMIRAKDGDPTKPLDGSSASMAIFKQWLESNPETNVTKAVEVGQTTTKLQAGTPTNVPESESQLKNIDAIVSQIKGAADQTQLSGVLTAQFHTQYPTLARSDVSTAVRESLQDYRLNMPQPTPDQIQDIKNDRVSGGAAEGGGITGGVHEQIDQELSHGAQERQDYAIGTGRVATDPNTGQTIQSSAPDPSSIPLAIANSVGAAASGLGTAAHYMLNVYGLNSDNFPAVNIGKAMEGGTFTRNGFESNQDLRMQKQEAANDRTSGAAEGGGINGPLPGTGGASHDPRDPLDLQLNYAEAGGANRGNSFDMVDTAPPQFVSVLGGQPSALDVAPQFQNLGNMAQSPDAQDRNAPQGFTSNLSLDVPQFQRPPSFNNTANDNGTTGDPSMTGIAPLS